MPELRISTATFDTNVFPAEGLVRRAERVGIAVAVITVSQREVEGSTLEAEVASLQSIMEFVVFDESRWDEAVWASDDDAARLDLTLRLLSNGAFPAADRRESLTNGQRRQLRDAMILCAHIRAGRDVLVSNDRRAFVDNGLRELIQSEFRTQVMTVAEFESHVALLESRNGAAV